jgi:hypothetical protein
MKNLKIKNLESLKSDLFQNQVVDGFNIRGGYGSPTYYWFYTGPSCAIRDHIFD